MTTALEPEQHSFPFSTSAREMIRFALRWAPFDSGDEYIFPQFGITPPTFYRRLAEILRDNNSQVDHAERETLTTLSHRKIRKASPSNRVSAT